MATVALRGFGEKRVARVTRRGLDRHLFFLRERANVRRAEFKINTRHLHCRASAPLAPPRARQAERLPYKFFIVAPD